MSQKRKQIWLKTFKLQEIFLTALENLLSRQMFSRFFKFRQKHEIRLLLTWAPPAETECLWPLKHFQVEERPSSWFGPAGPPGPEWEGPEEHLSQGGRGGCWRVSPVPGSWFSAARPGRRSRRDTLYRLGKSCSVPDCRSHSERRWRRADTDTPPSAYHSLQEGSPQCHSDTLRCKHNQADEKRRRSLRFGFCVWAVSWLPELNFWQLLCLMTWMQESKIWTHAGNLSGGLRRNLLDTLCTFGLRSPAGTDTDRSPARKTSTSQNTYTKMKTWSGLNTLRSCFFSLSTIFHLYSLWWSQTEGDRTFPDTFLLHL